MVLLEHQRSDPGDQEGQARLMNQALRLRQVLEAAGRMAENRPVQRARLEARRLASDLEDMFRQPLKSKSLALAVSVPAGLEPLGDEALLRDSVLGNLLSNAIKFSAPGGRLELAAAATEGGIEFTLKDQGPGLPFEVQRALDQGRVSPSSPGSLGETGHGYGLCLAKEYLHKMGGELRFETGPGGTLARVRLEAAG
jgi:signal transduction histidine kinase